MAEEMYGDEGEGVEVTDDQKIGIITWFLQRSPPGEIQQVAKSLRGVLMDERIFDMAAKEAFPKYNIDQMIAVDMADNSGQVLLTQYGAIDDSQHLEPRTAQVAVVDHVKQTCVKVRPAADDELPSAFVEDYRASVDAELVKYVEEAFPKGGCAVYCTHGKDIEDGGDSFELTAVISATKFSAQNFYSGSWRSVWKINISQELQAVEITGKVHVIAHYFEEGNVQLDTSSECSDSTLLQSSADTGVAVVNAIRHQESEYLVKLEESYSKLSDHSFKELRRKLPITRTRFSWSNTTQLSLSREMMKELSTTK